MSALSPSAWLFSSFDTPDARLLDYAWIAHPFVAFSFRRNVSDDRVEACGSAASSDHNERSPGPVFLARIAPLLAIVLLVTIRLLSILGRRRSSFSAKAAHSQAHRASLFGYLAPFVTDQNVRQYRDETARASHHHASSTSAGPHVATSLLGSQGFRNQRRRNLKLLFVTLFLAIAWTLTSGWSLMQSDSVQATASISQASGWLALFLHFLLRPPQTPTFALVVLLLALTISALVNLSLFIPLFHLIASQQSTSATISFLLSAANVMLCIYAFSLCLQMPVTPGGYEAVVDIHERLREQSDAPKHNPLADQDLAATYRLCPTTPEDYCNLFETLSYSWMAPIQKLALKRTLNPTDVWRLRTINDTRLLFRKFKALERPSTREAGKPSLLSRLLRANANDIALDAFFKLISVSFMYLGTYILKSILDQIQIAATQQEPISSTSSSTVSPDAHWSPRQKAFAYACIGLGLTVIRFLAELQNFHHARQVGMRIRSTLVVSLFEKALKRRDLSGQTKSPISETDRDDDGQESLSGSSTPLAPSPSQSGDGSASPDCPAEIQQLPPASSLQAAANASGVRLKRSWLGSLKVVGVKKRSSDSLWSRAKTQASRRKKRQAEKIKQREQEQGADIGKIVNMMASDINILLRMGCDLHQLYGAPLEVTIAAIFLYKLMGWSALAGFAILVAAIPVNYYWGEIAVKKQREYSSARDVRMSLMTELIDAMRFVKIQGVEPQWEERVAVARRSEIRKLIWSRVMTFLFELLWTVIPVLVTLVSFFFYVQVAKQELTVSTAFTAIALFTMIRPPLNAIPGFLMGGLIAMVSVQRLESFLNEQEVDEAVSRLSGKCPTQPTAAAYKDDDVNLTGGMASNEDDITTDDELAFKGCSFYWHAKQTTMRPVSSSPEPSTHDLRTNEQEHFVLRSLDVSFPPGRLSLVVGPTGCGKSSLLAAILGEMIHANDGAVIRNKFDRLGHSRFSFASQLPWLEAGKSVRENILFGTAFDQARYDMCIAACALQDDLDTMDDGDQTRIGSHTVSGGQKARISLARALYARTDTVLLDDVLSAVDTRVQNHIVKHALLGPISRSRRIILVTHHAHLLFESAALVISMRHGKIVHKGSPSELHALGLFAISNHQRHASSSENHAKAHPSASTLPAPVNGQGSGGSSGQGAMDASKTKISTGLASGARTPRLLHEEEKRREGAVSWVFYRTYLQASSLRVWALLVVFLLLLRLSESFGQYWLKVWGEAYKSYGFRTVPSAFTRISSRLPFDLPPADSHPGFYLSIYGLSGFAVILFNSSRAVCFYVASIRASQKLFSTLLANVIRAPLRWFDITPAGRIMNRFGTDMDCIDNILPQSIMNISNNVFSISAYFLICVIIVPSFLVPSAILVLLGPWLVGGFLASARDMQRLEATSTSPIYGHFQQALSGIVTIRAYGAEPRFLESMLDAVDLYQALWWAFCTLDVWLSFRSQILGGVSVFVVTLLALSGAVSPGSAGLAISSAQLLCQLALYLVNDFKNLSNSFNSLERVAEYQQMPREENDAIVARYSNELVPAAWPSRRGRIVFENVSLRYAEELPTVLKGVSFDVKPGEKVGIIGRTGSGKSSLASSLFRAVELSGGRILIDDIDIRTIPLQQLRGRLSIVMQDPVLFSGTVRDNLDPFHEHNDAEVLDALAKVGLADTASLASDVEDNELLVDVSNADGGAGADKQRPNMRLRLDTPVSSAGANFSAGQAQLLSLARSLLRSTRILILDEATSSTDMETDAMVQRVIRTALKDSIVICIAHRLKSVIDYDRVVVLQDGKLVECGSPKELLSKPDTDADAHFKLLCKHSAEYKQLCAAAGVDP